MKKILTNIILNLLISFSFIYAVDKTGTTAAKFLSIDVGSKAVGMGGAFTSIADDASAMYWNPAGLSYFNTREVYFNHADWIADISFDYFGFSIPLRPGRAIGINITSLTMGDMEVTRYGNENTGETFQASDYAAGFTYSMNLTDRFSIGINGKYIQQTIASSSARGAAMDMGTIFETPFGFRLGTAISNFGPKLKMSGDDLLIAADVNQVIEGNNESVTGILSTERFDLPLSLRFGISNEIKMGAIGQVLWSVDAVSPNDNANYINSGVEVTLLNNLLFFRAGANSMFLSDREKEYSFGFGLNVPGVMRNKIFLNYSFETMEYLGSTQQLGIRVGF
tara:strand:- start:102099 stop:103109 length:1011 start_codon:yes stop_codon:yes gene_type:complete